MKSLMLKFVRRRKRKKIRSGAAARDSKAQPNPLSSPLRERQKTEEIFGDERCNSTNAKRNFEPCLQITTRLKVDFSRLLRLPATPFHDVGNAPAQFTQHCC